MAGLVGRPVKHNDIDRGVWVDGAIAAGVVPADYLVAPLSAPEQPPLLADVAFGSEGHLSQACFEGLSLLGAHDGSPFG